MHEIDAEEPYAGGYRPAGAGRAVREHDPHPFHGRRPAGELRSSGDADGAGADRVPALYARHEALAAGPALAGARPLRPVLRARVDAALLDAPPGRLRRHA